MHEKLESLKPLLKAGEYEKAAAALKEYQTEFPDDWNGKLMEGIIAQLRGDEETFRRIHDEAQTIIDGRGKDAARILASPLWEKYHSSWKKIVKVLAILGLAVSISFIVHAYTYTNSIEENHVPYCVMKKLLFMRDVIEPIAYKIAWIFMNLLYTY